MACVRKDGVDAVLLHIAMAQRECLVFRWLSQGHGVGEIAEQMALPVIRQNRAAG